MYDNIVSILAFIIRQKKIPNIFNPSSLTEKILKIKLDRGGKRKELRKKISDRIKVRGYVEKNSPNCSLIKLLWHGTDFDKSVWDTLPQKFVIKANHGSKMVKIVNKEYDCYNDISTICNIWLNTDYYKKGREWVYKDLDKLLIIEEYIEFSGEVPPDFKFFCLNGVVRFVQVDLDRYSGHSRNIYSADFNLLDVTYQFPKGYNIQKPTLFLEAKKIAEELAKNFDFIRVDLYILEERIYFGELTNFPGNCLESFSPYDFDLQMGKYLNLDS
ncbi:hypothetical protein NAB31_04445 [Proteus mirabilis]|uniref:ATP-grasp fold amidoligase family protein n=1 Tax=Morganellaceae TaxID=1903414 RepID=UPI002025169F|nr:MULTISPECIES: ATP-grasp fold amidoligase family protein [Morganellaceae]MCL8608220.1 hypothetical protein [Proteus mirabilis]MDK7738487.1 ATP-grasp fold amidoligase family protein [Providencia stuartii]